MTAPVLSALRCSAVARTPRVAATSAVSPFTGTIQVQFWGGEWWEYELSFGPFRRLDARAMSGFLAALRGPYTVFLFEDPNAGIALPASPLVAGAGQTGQSLATDGWPINTVVMGAGDCFSLGSDTATRMHQITADVVSDGSGNATLPIWPALRSSPADDDPIEIRFPKVALRLISPAPTNVMSGGQHLFSLQAREAL